MSFLDMGIMEILLILLVALLIWGPGKLPDIARNLGKTMNTLKKASYDLTTQIRKELEETGDEPEKSSDTEKTESDNDKKAASQD